MESPDGWNKVTAALAVAGLTDAERAWGFLVELGLVGNRADLHRGFQAAVAEVSRQGEITGPSPSARVAQRLFERGALTFAGHEPDPGGARAEPAFAAFLARGAPVPPVLPAIFDEAHCRHCGRLTGLSPGQIAHCRHCGKDPVDLIALTLELGYSSATHTSCPRCARLNCFDRFCYYCGYAFEPGG